MSATHPYSGLKCFPGLAEFEFADYLSVLKGQTQQAEKSGRYHLCYFSYLYGLYFRVNMEYLPLFYFSKLKIKKAIKPFSSRHT